MDVFKDAELIFADTYAQKPDRTLKIPTSAPVQPTTVAVPPSSGVAEFATCDAWSDRFVVWRAIGNKLLMEERSLCRSVQKGSLCLDFGRTAIVPGTSITIERSFLCIVVPTQSAVHRFIARIVPDATHQFTEVNSFFTQISEKDFLGENHSYALLTTNAEVKKACVVTSMNTSTKVCYGMVDGQLVLINLPIKPSEKSEEVVLKEGGLISRLINSAGSEFLCDVDGVVTPKGNAMFYGIYSDGTLRIWTVDKQVRSTASVKLNLPGTRMDACNLFVRVYDVNAQRMVSIAAVEQAKTIFHNYSEESALLTYVSSNYAGFKGGLIDYQLVFHADPGLMIYAIWDSIESGGYQLRHTVVTSKNGKEVNGAWKQVKSCVQKEFDYASLKLQQIKEIILDTDMHSFDVVVRAVQISTGSTQCDIAHNDWKALQSFIENYIRSTEFHEKYGNRIRGGKGSRTDDAEQMQRRFYEALAATCEQLIEADRGAIGLFIIDLEQGVLHGVIQKDRFSVICKAVSGLSIEPAFENVLSEMVNAIPKPRPTSQDSDSDDGDDEIVRRLPICENVADKSNTLIQNFCAHMKMPAVRPTTPYKNPFWGKFTAGLISAFVRHTVDAYLALADSMLAVAKMLTNFDQEFSPRASALQSLRKLQADLSFLSRMLNLKMMMTNNMVMTLGSWLFSVVDLDYVRSVGGGPPEPLVKMNFNWFLDTTLDAALRALWISSPDLVACRKLAEAQKYLTLKRVCVLYDEARPSSLKSAINLYTGIAYCGMGQAKKAVIAFEESVNGIEAREEALHKALRSAGELELVYSTLGDLYSKAIRYLHEGKHEEEVVKLAKTAIDGLPEGEPSKNRIYATLFNQLVHQNKWAEALESIKANKDHSMREMTLRDFMTRILRAREWKMITNLYYGDLEEQVESILLSAARLQDLNTSPHLYEVLYAYYLDKNRLNKAAQMMLEYSMSLSQATQTPELFKRRRDVLATALTVLELTEEFDRFCYFPEDFTEEIDEGEAVVPDSDDMDVEYQEPVSLKRTIKKRRIVIVDEKSVQREWAVAKARLVILDDSMLPPSEPTEILRILIEAKHYDDALDMCREFDLNAAGILSAVTTDTIMLDATQPLEMPLWKRENRRHDTRGIGDNWGVVRGLLSTAHRFWPADSRPYRAVTTAILAHGVNIPCWLQAEYSEFDLPDFVRCLVDYDSLPLALDMLTRHIKDEAEKVTSTDVTTYVPYTVLNEVIAAASTEEECKPMLSTLNTQLRLYLDRISGYETAHRFGS